MTSFLNLLESSLEAFANSAAMSMSESNVSLFSATEPNRKIFLIRENKSGSLIYHCLFFYNLFSNKEFFFLSLKYV